MKKFAYFAAVSVVLIAQAALAQNLPIPSQIPGSKSGPVSGQAVTLTAVSAKPKATVTLTDGKVWAFPPNFKGATVAGVAVEPSKLTVGMSCLLTGVRSPLVNAIEKLACK